MCRGERRVSRARLRSIHGAVAATFGSSNFGAPRWVSWPTSRGTVGCYGAGAKSRRRVRSRRDRQTERGVQPRRGDPTLSLFSGQHRDLASIDLAANKVRRHAQQRRRFSGRQSRRIPRRWKHHAAITSIKGNSTLAGTPKMRAIWSRCRIRGSTWPASHLWIVDWLTGGSKWYRNSSWLRSIRDRAWRIVAPHRRRVNASISASVMCMRMHHGGIRVKDYMHETTSNP